MNDWKVRDVDTDDEWHKDNRTECEQAIEDFGDVRDLEIIPPSDVSEASEESDGADNQPQEETASDGGETATAKPMYDYEDENLDELPDLDNRTDITEDPVDYLPSHFVDTIQGVPTLNRKGYAVMSERFNVSVTSEPVVRASETDFEYAEFTATAVTDDGTEYSGFGSAHVDRMDGDDEYLLNELAETRAMKRAASWALGLGMTAKVEMEGTL